MDLQLSLDGQGGLAERLYRELACAITERRLAPGERLPSSRELTAQLSIARATVTVVYERLIAEGYAESRPGVGTFAATELLPQLRPPRRRTTDAVAAPTTPGRPRTPIAYDFTLGIPDAALFPLASWRRHLSREIDAVARDARYGDPLGHPGLRSALAHHVRLTRGVTAEPGDILITDGAQHAFDLLARHLVRPGDTVAVEEPGYPLVRSLLESLGAEIVGLPVDEDGADAAALPPSARLIHVTPTHQFPTGVVMTRPRRIALLEAAARSGALVIEDDYDSEYRFDGRPLETLHSLDRAGTVAYVGTFSKSLLPALRTGYLIPPRRLLPPLRELRRVTGWHGDLTTQGALARMLDSGDYATHLRRARRTYRARRAAILDDLGDDRFGIRVEVAPSSAGLHVSMAFPDAPPGLSERVAVAAESAGVRVEALPLFFRGTPREGLVLGYGSIRLEQVGDGLRVLRGVIRRAALG